MSGWGGWGGSGAGGPPGDPMLSEALITSRGGIAGPPLDGKFNALTVGNIDLDARLMRWEPLVRFNVMMVELTSHVHFEASGQTAWFRHVDLDVASKTAAISPIVAMARPAPADVDKYFGDQLKYVMNWARYRNDRRAEIVSQLAPQTPYWAAIANIQPNRHRFTLELLAVGLAFVSSAAMRFKHALALPRPAEFSAKVQSMVPTPEHSTLPSGHASEAYMAAHLLRALIDNAGHADAAQSVFNQLEALAARIAINRTIAGVHFPADSLAGRLLGATVAEYVAHRCTGLAGKPTEAKGWTAWSFVPSTGLKDDFPSGERGTIVSSTHEAKAVQNNPLAWLWTQARQEWQ